MIYDKIDNLETYAGLSEDIRMGLEWLYDVNPSIEIGVHQINQHVKAIVSEYETKTENEHGYEAHRKNIDIQYLLSGEERIACLPIERLKEAKAYNEENDAAFYAADLDLLPSYLSLQPSYLSLLPGYFAVFFPQDGHMPQLCIDKPMKVKKVVVKVKIGE